MDLIREFMMYRKLEVVLFRYVKIMEFLEYTLRINLKMKDSYELVLNPKGYDNCTNRMLQDNLDDGNIYIPFNPFYLDKEEERIFLQIFPEKFWEWKTESNEQRRKILAEIWKRIHEIKWWLGVTVDTRFCGIRKESRLVTILEKYLASDIKEFRYDFEHSIFRHVPRDTIKKFLSVAKNRKRRRGIIWMKR